MPVNLTCIFWDWELSIAPGGKPKQEQGEQTDSTQRGPTEHVRQLVLTAVTHYSTIM